MGVDVGQERVVSPDLSLIDPERLPGGPIERNGRRNLRNHGVRTCPNRVGEAKTGDIANEAFAIAEVGSRIVHVRVRCDAIVQKVKCADANGLLKVKVSRAKMIGSRLMTVQERRVLARIPDPVVRKRVCREE